MEFWNVFAEESLQKPWLISNQAHAPEVSEPHQDKIFILPPGTEDSLYAMVAKMIHALKLRPDEVAILELSQAQLSALESWSEGKRILFFGDEYPGEFGDFIHSYGSLAMRTHALDTLATQVDLKKVTWQHLKKYASFR